MKEIEKIIFNSLSLHRAIFLPELGTLSVKRIPAAVAGKGKVRAPENRVVFYKEELAGCESVVDLAEALCGDKARVEREYAEWLKGAATDNGFVAEWVGELKNGRFTTFESMRSILNPDSDAASREAVPAGVAVAAAAPGKPRAEEPDDDDDDRYRRRRLTNTLLIILIVLLLLLGGYYTYRTLYCGASLCSLWKTEQTDAVAGSDADATAEGEAAAGEEGLQASQDAGAAAGQGSVRKGYYVVAGAFTYEANADKMVRSYKNKYGIEAQKVPGRNGMTMVTLFWADNIHKAYNKRLEYEMGFYIPDLWVYEAK